MRKSTVLLCLAALAAFFHASCGYAAKVVAVRALDKDHLMVVIVDGDVEFKEDGSGITLNMRDPNVNKTVLYGDPLDPSAAGDARHWTILSNNDAAYGTGKHPTTVWRKSKVSGMAQKEWVKKDYRYETPLQHILYLRLPTSLQEGKTYTLTIGDGVHNAKSSHDLTFKAVSSKTEAIHVNLVGYLPGSTVKSVDLYQWMGDGGARDYSDFVGKPVYVYDVKTKKKSKAGTVKFWKKQGKDVFKYDMMQSDVWTADVAIEKPGTYRVVIDGIGCSRNFEVAKEIYKDPCHVLIQGYYYMRIGEKKNAKAKLLPRQPRYIPGKDPKDTKILITTMHNLHPQWKTFAGGGDCWDKADKWDPFVKPGRPENPNAYGGHSDALDWDRHLGHVTSIYDILLPYLLTSGAVDDDDAGIAESGNGIPDIIDEARNEVDFWLRLRDGEAYSCGLTCPNGKNVFYQAGTTTEAAWANSVNAAMLAVAFDLAKKNKLRDQYGKAAATAYAFAEKQTDAQPGRKGLTEMTEAELKTTAAVYLFKLTGETKYAEAVKAGMPTGEAGTGMGLIWAVAGYLAMPSQRIDKPLAARLKKVALHMSHEKETKYSATRPSRRSTDQDASYFHTIQNVHWTLLAHFVTREETYLNALLLEADWGLGRNPLNMIQMTTASTALAGKRSVMAMYTSGGYDGTPGMHPGHTPYMNTFDWGKGMATARPRYLAAQGYPAFERWPIGECFYNTRWVWAHSEFTPQQTMRGKMALYGYLYGIGKKK